MGRIPQCSAGSAEQDWNDCCDGSSFRALHLVTRIPLRLPRTLSTATASTAVFGSAKRNVPVTPEEAHRQVRTYPRFEVRRPQKLAENTRARGRPGQNII